MAKKTEEISKLDIINLKHRNDLAFHKMKMEELAYARETIKINHENEIERQRIKSADIKKTLERKQASQFPRY